MNCGGSYRPDEEVCSACGLSKDTCPAALGVIESSHEPVVVTAQADFHNGLFRRGLAILNYALVRNRTQSEAWLLKARFLHSLGFNRAAAEMLDAALTCGISSDQQVQLLEEQSFLWAECSRGEEAVASADAAWRLGSNSIRTHYLRGRGLALIGRLAEAREEMLQVLAQDRDNPDARRGLSMIDNVLKPANTN
jgi:tetratricopeptide (TPR) repeat protein